MKKNDRNAGFSQRRIPPVAENDLVNVIIETPKGSRMKFKYEEELGVFELGKLLPKGLVFPFDFGFVPQTQAEDGDPIDVLVLMDEPVFPGCVVKSRLIGVLEAEQTEDGEINRNDRIIAVARTSIDFAEVRTLADLPDSAIEQIEHFFVNYNAQSGKDFKVLARRGRKAAWGCLQRTLRAENGRRAA